MQVDKDTVLNLIREHADDAKVQQAAQELPERIDLDEHAGQLSKFGVSPQELISKVGGQGGLGGLLG